MPVTYDSRGNLTSDSTWTYTYNAAGRMVRAESISATQVYTYNGDGPLVAQSLDGVETSFTWDQALGIPQVLATSDGVRSVYGLGRLGVEQGGQWYYPHGDALGSVRQWTEALAAVLGTQSYSPFGEPLSALAVAPWGFTGEWHDPSGLVYLRARWYNAALGRFTQVDPFPGLLPEPGTRHPYAYALNTPILLSDPSGEIAPWLGALGISVGVGAVVGAIGSGISYAVGNPGHSLSEYVHDRGFWRSVGSGAVAGATAGLAIWALPTPTTLLGTVGVGAASGALGGGAGRLTENLLTPCTSWEEGIPEGMLLGGLAGGATAGLFYGVGQWLRGGTLERQLQGIASRVDKMVPGRGPVAGTRKHTLFQEQVESLGRPHVRTEVSYLNRSEVRRGTPGSVRLDVVVEAIDRAGNVVVQAVYDLKTGTTRLTAARILQIQAHLPNTAPVIQISP